MSARGDPIDRILGLELGADDYLSKPLEPRELLARINALIRRSQGVMVHAYFTYGSHLNPFLLMTFVQLLNFPHEAFERAGKIMININCFKL